VVRFLSAKDVPDGFNPMKVMGNCDEDIFAADVVQFEGHPIGAVVAATEKIARAAAALVRVEYKPLRPIVSINDAIVANSYIEVMVAGMHWS
jgi:xanthine dehydrogenase molybdopterin-binding subunit B